MPHQVSTTSTDDNAIGGQVLVLFSIIALLGIVIVSASGSGSREFVATFATDEPNLISNPQIDETERENANLPTVPVAMFNLENPNGWDTPENVTLVGTLQDELGCESDNQINCTQSQLDYDILSDIWRATLELPAGNYAYRAYLNRDPELVYGQNGISGESSHPIMLLLNTDQVVNFYYDHKTGWITDDVNSTILTLPSNFQDNVGCKEEWNANCFRTWLQDIEGDGIYTYETLHVPGGSWEARVAVDGNLDASYGQGGEFDGDNIPLWIPNIGHLTVFTWDNNLKTLTVFVSNFPLLPSEALPPLAPNQ